jgi:hypothetical protein
LNRPIKRNVEQHQEDADLFFSLAQNIYFISFILQLFSIQKFHCLSTKQVTMKTVEIRHIPIGG